MNKELTRLTGPLSDWEDKIEKAKGEYKFQKSLTEKLDNHEGLFTEKTLLEIVLWKTNRYPELSESLLDAINDLRSSYAEEKARRLLFQLLDAKGFDLAMASTVLRFACPHELQIIDQRVYRLIYLDNKLRKTISTEAKVDLYFEYISKLKTVCKNYNIPFFKADRILYQLDKMENKDFPIKY